MIQDRPRMQQQQHNPGAMRIEEEQKRGGVPVAAPVQNAD